MARYKPYSYAQGKFIPIHFADQILPGTFELSKLQKTEMKQLLIIWNVKIAVVRGLFSTCSLCFAKILSKLDNMYIMSIYIKHG